MEKPNTAALVHFGLVGKNISYSFSAPYFTEKFKKLRLTNYHYLNFDIPHITHFPRLLEEHPGLRGLNVTIPYKEAILPYLNELSDEAREIGAVNTIAHTKNGLKGFNTDYYGFTEAITPLLQPHHKKALILGYGGASKAIAYSLEKLGIPYQIVSRNSPHTWHYQQLTEEHIATHPIIINATPLGTAPNIEEKPPIPYAGISPHHLLYDLVYNPALTAFLQEGKKRGAILSNGLNMLHLQAEKAWEIWNSIPPP